MKLLGGSWSRGDVLALMGVLAAVLAIPGMPKLLHLDSDNSSKQRSMPETAGEKPPIPAAKPIQRTRDASSTQVNFGCDQTLPVETPVVQFGKNPRNVEARAAWDNTDNVKTQNQAVMNVENPVSHQVVGVKATGTIVGRDSEGIAGFKNCPGGGHGELTLHVSWIEDE
jgi:hypothetical protein